MTEKIAILISNEEKKEKARKIKYVRCFDTWIFSTQPSICHNAPPKRSGLHDSDSILDFCSSSESKEGVLARVKRYWPGWKTFSAKTATTIILFWNFHQHFDKRSVLLKRISNPKEEKIEVSRKRGGRIRTRPPKPQNPFLSSSAGCSNHWTAR